MNNIFPIESTNKLSCVKILTRVNRYKLKTKKCKHYTIKKNYDANLNAIIFFRYIGNSYVAPQIRETNRKESLEEFYVLNH